MLHRRYLSLIVAGLIVVVAACCITGCGGAVGKAKEYMKKGDQIVDSSVSKTQELKEKLQLFGSSQSMDGNRDSSQSVEALKKFKDELEPLLAELQTGAEEAKSEFEKIKKLKGVPSYVEYAKLQIQAIDMGILLLEMIVGFMNDSIEKLSNGSYSPQNYVSKIGEITTELSVLFRQMGKIYDGSQELKASKKL